MATGTPPEPPGRQATRPAAAPAAGPQDVTRRLDGLRGWLAEIDRSLRRRSVIALVLTALAIGAGAAAIYISLTKNADSDRIDALETRIENLEAAAAGVAGTDSVTEPLPDGTTQTPTPTPDTDQAVPVAPPDAGVAEDGASGGASP